jgi:hypothetical protein
MTFYYAVNSHRTTERYNHQSLNSIQISPFFYNVSSPRRGFMNVVTTQRRKARALGVQSTNHRNPEWLRLHCASG